MNCSIGDISFIGRICLRLAVFPNALHQSDVVNPQAWRLTGVGKMSWTALRKLNFSGSMCLRSPHVTALSFVLSHLVHVPCFLCPTAVAICVTTSRWWISFKTIFFLFIVDSLDHQRCSSICHSANYFFHLKGRFCILYCYFRLPFLTCYYRRLGVLCSWVTRVTQHLEKLHFT